MKFWCSLIIAALSALHAETGYNAWLRYAPLDNPPALPAVVSVAAPSVLETSAQQEMIRGLRGMTGRTLRAETGLPKENAIVIGTVAQLAPELHLTATLGPDAYLLKTVVSGTRRYIVIAGGDERGALYGAFALLRKVALSEPITALDEHDAPYAPLRWVNQWDNLEGTVERGYGGRSIFWDGLKSREDMNRVSDYGRLLASLGINGCSINNVNANPKILTADLIPHIARIADAFRPWGVRVMIAVDFGSPKTIGGMDTFDPVEPKVADWWKARFDEIYKSVPDLAGVVLKADSEGRVGPATYGRSHADAANLLARALKPHGGILFYRGFVYDHHMDWNNPKNDRGRAAYDNFHDLDGKFDDNVIVQVKNGPIDFQVREPASPLVGALEKTNQAMELQVTQEYFGQSKHTVFLVPMWKDVLDFDMHAKGGAPTPLKALSAGKTFGRPLGGFVGVVNIGLDDNWSGNHLSQANLYGYGRLAWNPDLSSRRIADEWTKLTFGTDPKVDETVESIQLTSWRTYENYTGPLGLQTLTDITGNHYGVNVEASERNGWGQWHRADENGVGMDRTVATGTGYIGQYRKPVAQMYESLATCPDDLLLFLHHVPYTYKLHNGKTVVQYIYDSHYEGADAVAGYARQWKTLRGLVDEQRYKTILAQLEYQAGQAAVWRDAVNVYFQKMSKIADAKGRVGHWPGRYEAEAMTLKGYTARDVVPSEDASGGKGVACAAGAGACAASLNFTGEAGWYTLRVEYFDQSNGLAHYKVWVGKQLVDEWAADLRVPSMRLDSSTSTRRTIAGIALRPGDEIRIEGEPNGGELAGLDYVEIIR
jgi:alpha-glucuronidase